MVNTTSLIIISIKTRIIYIIIAFHEFSNVKNNIPLFFLFRRQAPSLFLRLGLKLSFDKAYS